MNHSNIFFGIAVFILANTSPVKSLAQDAKPFSFLGTKTPYVFTGESYLPAPPGYHPFFVNYVGRHGARFLTKAGADINVVKILDKAASSNALTVTGRAIKKMAEILLTLETGNYENITLSGAKEQQAIGKRILSNYGQAFTGKGLDVFYTYKVRTKQSADAFLSAFSKIAGNIKFTKTVDSMDFLLRFYDLSPAYLSYKKSTAVKESLDSLDKDPREAVTVKNICSKIFNRAFAEQLCSSKEGNTFVENLYDLYAAGFSLSGELERKGYNKDSIDLGIAFNSADLKWMDFKNGAADFMEKGPATNALGIQVKIAAPLLADLINYTDEAVNSKGKRVDAVFRFTHAEAISPLATLLGIPLVSAPSPAVFNYHNYWHAEDVIPLSANIQWIIYYNGSDFLVKILLNEREVALPIPSSITGPYYKWSVLKDYCLKRLQSAGADLHGDMLKYLREVK